MTRSKPKLIYILPEFSSQTDTHYFHIYELLEKLGQKMDIFLLVEKASGPVTIANMQVVYTPRFSQKYLSLLERFWWIFQARLLDYKTCYAHYSYSGAIFASLIYRLFGGSVFYWHCEVYEKFFSDFRLTWDCLWKKLSDEWLMWLVMKMVTSIVTCTPTTAEFYRKTFFLPEEKFTIISNWINLERFRGKSKKNARVELNLPRGKKIVLFLHRLSPRKGADFLPEIILKTSRQVKDVFFVIAGDGPLKKYLQIEFNKLDLKPYVRFVGSVPNKDVLDYYSSADLFIMPSRREGFARVIIEAMAVGVPFLATGIGGIKDVVSPIQRRCLLPVGDTDKFADKLVLMLTNKKLAQTMRLEGERYVERYSLDTIVDRFYNLLSR